MQLREAQELWSIWDDLIGHGRKPVAIEKAQARSDICRGCPRNERKGLEEKAKKKLVQLLTGKLERRSKVSLHVTKEEELHLCGVCRCVLTLLVFMPDETLQKEMATDERIYPEICWKRKLKNHE